MSTRSKGVTKRKGTSVTNMYRISTRNRSKVERLRDSLNDLNLEDRKGVVTRSNLREYPSRMGHKSHDFQIGNHTNDRGTNAEMSELACNEITKRGSILRRHNCEIRTPGESDFTKVTFDSSHEFEMAQWQSSTESFQSDNAKCPKSFTEIRLKRPSGVSRSPWGVGDEGDFPTSVPTGSVKSTKRKHDKDLFSALDNLKNLRTAKDLQPLSASSVHVFRDSADSCDYDVTVDTCYDMMKDEYSPSPPNSPLYDMPPPSTLAQKEERRAKRNLQLERWRKYETSKCRQERYEKRAREAAKAEMKSALESRRVQWSNDLVQTVYIDDISE